MTSEYESTGRYLTRDPIGYADGMNVYLSVHNNPINHIDPLGLFGDSEDGRSVTVERGDTIWRLWKDKGGKKGTGHSWNEFQDHIRRLNHGINLDKLTIGQQIAFVGSQSTTSATGQLIGQSQTSSTIDSQDGFGPDDIIYGEAGASTMVGAELIRASDGRRLYNELVKNLDPDDAAGRARLKEFVRTLKPKEVNDAIKEIWPDTGARPGSVGHANVSNKHLDELFEQFRRFGKATVVAGVAVDTYMVATAEDKPRALAQAGGGNLGAIGSAKLGATIGTYILPGWGTAIGAIVFGIGGGIVGSWAAGEAHDIVEEASE